ncbi:nitroreductase family protein [Lederbergia galactosidilytica]|uniref:NADH dehydrogenase n=1 Tax=Lederbergia galactosidilytica TaxID=217031 RepID=A0A0Q9Y5I4_9BACI|nr:nitroreductase family protein [Lederbergia galactosidilytica]KRG16240.1 NADH dehydrogenase [Lederbergia galactosidilytica]MBP1916983.1 nitroreductase [Lederbergia galactosidilytica]OAK67456.1 NADH dehydrogenase [Lederbergia galactosidilytica]
MNGKDYRQAIYNIDPIFLERWSPRAFSQQEVPEDILNGILEAACWAPSAANIQPWRFIIARNKGDRNHFHSFINEGNLTWCKNAPVLILIMSKTSTERGPSISHAFDAGTAWGFLSLEAAKKGLITHAMGGFNRDKAREKLGISDDYQLHAVVAVGYLGDMSELSADHQAREKPSNRRPLKETIFEGKFGESAKI